jgi:hypothetical protein
MILAIHAQSSHLTCGPGTIYITCTPSEPADEPQTNRQMMRETRHEMNEFTLAMNTSNPLEITPEQTRDVARWELETRDGVLVVTGRLIGWGTSRRLEHNHTSQPARRTLHPSQQFTPEGRCSACRWTELYIFRVVAGDGPSNGHYLVYSLGPSVAPGEKTFANTRWATSGFEVVELCTVRRGDRVEPFLPGSNARALAMAASHDVSIESAYVNRAVA